MEINEEIVKEYFCVVLGCFVIENVIYRVETQRNGKKRGGGWSDIDLLAYYPMENNVLDIEVKYRERAPFHRGKDKASNIDNVIYNIHTPNRNRKIQELNKNSLAVQKIFVTNKKAFSEKRRLEYESLLSDNEIQLIYFETMFSELQNYYRQNPNKMTSIIGQMLRIYNNQNKNRVYNSQISSGQVLYGIGRDYFRGVFLRSHGNAGDLGRKSKKNIQNFFESLRLFDHERRQPCLTEAQTAAETAHTIEQYKRWPIRMQNNERDSGSCPIARFGTGILRIPSGPIAATLPMANGQRIGIVRKNQTRGYLQADCTKAMSASHGTISMNLMFLFRPSARYVGERHKEESW